MPPLNTDIFHFIGLFKGYSHFFRKNEEKSHGQHARKPVATKT